MRLVSLSKLVAHFKQARAGVCAASQRITVLAIRGGDLRPVLRTLDDGQLLRWGSIHMLTNEWAMCHCRYSCAGLMQE